jgi:enoyl-CoA hydratase/carnithine racemase
MAIVDIERDGAVRTIRLNRPEKRNAMNNDMLNALLDAFSEAPSAEERVNVICSEGAVFCAGRDLRETSAGGPQVDIEAVFYAVETYPLPVVARVQGAAIAGGCELALHCDFVVAAESAMFGMSLAQIGLAPTWFLAKKLLETAGPVGAREILLLGDPLPASRLCDLGVISRVAAAEELDDALHTIVDRLQRNAPLSLRAIKALLLREMTYRDRIAHDDVDLLVRAARKSPDALEGMQARLDKREPRFEGKSGDG